MNGKIITQTVITVYSFLLSPTVLHLYVTAFPVQRGNSALTYGLAVFGRM